MFGRDILPIARVHIGERYILGARAPLTNPNHQGPWDCAEFASWCAYQAYRTVFGAYGQNPTTADPYSGKWYDDGQAAGTLIPVSDALGMPGAFVVRKPGDFNIGIGHVAISVGDGTLLEARSSSTGVVLSTNAASRSWTAGVQIPGVEYPLGDIVPHRPPADILKIAHPFIRGDHVRIVQCAVARRGFLPGAIDGIYGPKTSAAVANYQLAEGLVVDGEVGPETADHLEIGWPIDVNRVDEICADVELPVDAGDEPDIVDDLRGEPDDETAGGPAAAPVRIEVFKKGDRDFWARSGHREFYVGRRVPYGAYYGLYQRIADLPKLIGGKYDRQAARAHIGDWADVLWPTTEAESSGYYCRINTYDRARFTFGCFQMAAHTARDNLILFFRDILTLPDAERYFPELTLENGRVHILKGGQARSLEREEINPRTGEAELPDFMAYLNPSLDDVEVDEVINAARLMLWTEESEAVKGAQVRFAKSTISAKLDHANAKGIPVWDLTVPLGIWVLDVRHQGRAKYTEIKSALRKANPYEAMKWVGRSEKFKDRVNTVDDYIGALLNEQPAYRTMKMGELLDN